MEQANNTLPAVTLGQYKGLSVVRHVRPVTEKAIDQEITHQTRLHAVYHDSAEPARRGSRVLIDFEGFLNGEPIPDSRMEKVMVCLGDGKLMPAAEQAICGHCAGEVFRFDFTYPAEFRVPELSGQTAQFEVHLHSVAEKSIPAPDEAFARSRGYDSLAAMREAVRAKKAADHEANADRKASAELLDMAGANLTVTLPAAAVERNAEQELRKLRERLRRSGISMEDFCKGSHTTPEALEERYRKDAERRMRSVLAARAIAEQEHIEVSTLEINAEYRRLSNLHDTPEEEIRRVLSPDAIAASVAARKVQAFLLEQAQVRTVMDSARINGAEKE